MEQPISLIGALNSPRDKSADKRQSLETTRISRGTGSSNPPPSNGESANFQSLSVMTPSFRCSGAMHCSDVVDDLPDLLQVLPFDFNRGGMTDQLILTRARQIRRREGHR